MHAKLGVPIARRILRKSGHSKCFIDEVCYLIAHHCLRGNTDKTLELQILQDADLIADVGLGGFIRPFLYCGKFNEQSVIGSIKYVQKEDRIRNRLNLAVSKSIAKREMKIQKHLVHEISKLIDSDLL